jgi:hypothetical protein
LRTDYRRWAMRMRRPNVKVSGPLVDLAAQAEPPLDLKPYVGRARKAGATELYVAAATPQRPAWVEVSSADVARELDAAICVRGRRVLAYQEILWVLGGGAVRDALDRVVKSFQAYDEIARFRFAATDMGLVVEAARALIDAREADGPARLWERTIETGMVVTYARPYIKSNDVFVGEKWWPRDGDRELHHELMDRRDEYDAHIGRTPRRALENTAALLGYEGRPIWEEAWEQLPLFKLGALQDLASRQAERFDAEARRLDRVTFGPLTDES